MKKGGDIKQYSVAGGVVFQDQNALILSIPTRGEFRLPKGHIEKGETPSQTALREVAEESGYAALEILTDLGTQLVVFDYGQSHIIRREYYYLMKLTARQTPQPAEEQFTPLWMPWQEALERLTFEPEKEWLRRALAAWQNLPEISSGSTPFH